MRYTMDILELEPHVFGHGVATVHPYCGRASEPEKDRGARAEVTFFGKNDKEEFTLEGPIDQMIRALTDALDMLTMMNDERKKELEESIKHSVKCSVCNMYYDKRNTLTGHSDGRGASCLGDGTIFLHCDDPSVSCLKKHEDGSWSAVLFKDLARYDHFKIDSELDQDGEYVFLRHCAQEETVPPYSSIGGIVKRVA